MILEESTKEREKMSILDVTEDKIFETLGKGRDPNFKPIEKVRPVIVKPKKTYSVNQTIKTTQPVKNVQPVVQSVVQPVVQPVIEPAKKDCLLQVDENMQNLKAELNQLNNRVEGIQKMVKWYIMPQFILVLVLLLLLFGKSNFF